MHCSGPNGIANTKCRNHNGLRGYDHCACYRSCYLVIVAFSTAHKHFSLLIFFDGWLLLPALNLFRHNSKCILSFSASSSNVAIQPRSLSSVRRERKCLKPVNFGEKNICQRKKLRLSSASQIWYKPLPAATNPGTPATDSKTIRRHSIDWTEGLTSLYPVRKLKEL